MGSGYRPLVNRYEAQCDAGVFTTIKLIRVFEAKGFFTKVLSLQKISKCVVLLSYRTKCKLAQPIGKKSFSVLASETVM